jgi:hypothetical protein
MFLNHLPPPKPPTIARHGSLCVTTSRKSSLLLESLCEYGKEQGHYINNSDDDSELAEMHPLFPKKQEAHLRQ